MRGTFEIIFAALLSAVASGDVLRLESGGELHGTIVKRTADRIWIDVGPKVIDVSVEDVAETLMDDQSHGSLEQGAFEFLFRTATGLAQLSPREQAARVSPTVIKVRTPRAIGSGVFVNEDGYAITNAHVIQGETDLRIIAWLRQPDGSTRRTTLEDIEIISVNNHLDLALLRAIHPAGEEFEFALLEHHESIEVGQPVFAIGNPHGLEQTMSQGVISTTQRSNDGLTFIQTDTAVNPGNSGGPLFNTLGEVVGITNMIRRDAEALNFAIPTRYVKDFIRNRDAYTYDAKNPNSGHKYHDPPTRQRPGTPPQLHQPSR